MRRLTKSEFIAKAILVHGNKYIYKNDYQNSRSLMNIECKKHGIFKQTGSLHLSGSGCPKCGLKKIDDDDFIIKANLIHKNKFDYSLVKIKNTKTKVKIICKEHGVFEQLPQSHLKGNGCAKCNFENIHKKNNLTTDDFITKSNLTHNGEFDYSLVNYMNNLTKVKIICKEHGIFEQTPHHHKRGGKCKKCVNKNISERAIRDSRGWSLSDWESKIKNCPESKPILYLIKCYNENEKFIKIGITMRSVKARFCNKKLMPYNYEIIIEQNGNAKEIFNMEVLIKQELKEKKYKPLLKFSGYKETFEVSSESEIIYLIKTHL